MGVESLLQLLYSTPPNVVAGKKKNAIGKKKSQTKGKEKTLDHACMHAGKGTGAAKKKMLVQLRK